MKRFGPSSSSRTTRSALLLLAGLVLGILYALAGLLLSLVGTFG
jgi:hypothetical protein